MGVFEDISNISNPFGANSAGKWNLTKGIYTNSLGESMVLFFEERKGDNKRQLTALETTSDSGGRRLAVYEYPYVDGQRVEDLGRKGETHNLMIKFVGDNYQQLLRQFTRVVINDSGTGTLLHPTLSAFRGALKVRLKDYEQVHRYDEWNAVSLKVVFIEDNTGEIGSINQNPSVDSALKSALQTLTNAQSFIGQKIFEIGALAQLPGEIINSLNARLNSITGGFSRLIGQLAATFSPTSSVSALSAAADAAGTTPSGTSGGTLNDGTVLPPVYQVGYNPTTQAAINAQIDNYVNANQTTPQQAVFNANQQRLQISTAIAELETYGGNDAYDAVLSYRDLANSVQLVTEVCISSSRSKVKQYIVPYAMSLRLVAKLNGLLPEKQNDIEALNPYLPSVNYVAAGSRLLVPVS